MGLAQLGVATADTAFAAAGQASLLATGLPPQVAQAVLQDLAWLVQANPSQRPYTLATHCLCASP